MIYFYFNFSRSTKINYSTMIRSLIGQLARYFDDVPVSAQTLFSKHVGNNIKVPSEPRRRLLITVLLNLLDLLPEVYIIIDALDEYTRSEDRELLNTIGELIRAGISSLKILYTSRKTDLIEFCFAELAIQAVGLKVTYVDGDVALYVRRKLQSDDFVDFSKEVKRDIETTLMTLRTCSGQQSMGSTTLGPNLIWPPTIPWL